MRFLSKTRATFVFCVLFYASITMTASAGLSIGTGEELGGRGDPFEWSIDAPMEAISPGGSAPIQLTFSIPKRHYLYRDKMEMQLIQGDKVSLKSVTLPSGLLKIDPITGEPREVYEGDVVINGMLEVAADAGPGSQEVLLQFAYQGCSDKLCFREMRPRVSVKVKIEKFQDKTPRTAGGCSR